MTEEQKIEQIKRERQITTKQALAYLEAENMTPEQLADLQQKACQAVENPYGTWGTINTSQIFGKQ